MENISYFQIFTKFYIVVSINIKEIMKRISNIQDDEEDNNEQQQFSSIRHKMKALNNRPKETSSRGIKIVIFFVALLIFWFLFINKSKYDKGGQEVRQSLKKMKQQEQTMVKKVSELEAQVSQYKKQIDEQKNKNIESQKKPTASAEIPKPAPLTVETKSEKSPVKNYLTPELQSISQKRTQRTGMLPIAQGTVSQIKYLIKNKDGKGIEDVIYKDDQMRTKRVTFYNERVNFLKEKTQFPQLYLVKYNFKIDNSLDQQEKKADAQQYERIRKIHELDKYTQEIPMCLIVPGYNNNAKFRLQYNLNSIFSQNYTNYFAVIINDASTDGSDELFRKYLQFYNISKTKYVYIQNTQRKTALENIYMASHYYCGMDSVAINLDGDDQFIGKNVLKAFNAGYQRHKPGVLYSNFFWYEQKGNVMLGFTSEYTDTQKKNNGYRHAPQRFSHLRSYRTELFRRIDSKDFQDDKGKFYTIAYDMVMYFPLMELSCGRIAKIEGYHYLYNINTGLNDYQVDRNKQTQVDGRVRSAKKYTCYEQFNKRMSG